MDPPVLLIGREQLRLEVHETELSVAVLVHHDLEVKYIKASYKGLKVLCKVEKDLLFPQVVREQEDAKVLMVTDDSFQLGVSLFP